MQGIILAAGKGTRLQPVTPARTKAMAPVAGKPIVARVLDLFLQNDLRDIILLISPDDPDIRPYMEAAQQNGHLPDDLTLQFVVQQERLGMAHALTLLSPHIHGDFLMSACDNLVPPDHVAALLTTFHTQRANAVLSLMEIDIAESAKTGIVEWNVGIAAREMRWIRRIVEKPQPAEAPSNVSSLPLYVFAHTLLDYLPQVQPSPRGEYELQDAIQLLIEDVGGVTGVLTEQRWQLTNVEDLLALSRHFLANDPQGNRIPLDITANNLLFHRPVHIDPGSVVGDNCVIGPNVYIESGCRIGNSVQLSNAIVLRGTTIADNRIIADAVVMEGTK